MYLICIHVGPQKKYEAAHRFAFNETEKSEIIENV